MPNTIEFFHGDGCQGEIPHTFLKRIVNRFPTNTTDAAKLEIFSNHLASSSVAEDWYDDDLTPADKASWSDLATVFKTRWLKEKKPTLTWVMKKEKLLAIELKEEDIGKLIGDNDEQEWGHVAWAKKIVHMAGVIGDSKGDLIEVVLEKIPEVMCNELSLEYTTWQDFLNGIQGISNARIAENRKRLNVQNELINEVAQLKEQLASPLSPLRQQLARTSISSSQSPFLYQPNPVNRPVPVPPAIQYPSTPQMAPGPPPPSNPFYAPQTLMNGLNLFYNHHATPFTPSPTRTPDDVHRTINALPHHPDTEAGCTAYDQQVRDWHTTHGDTLAVG